MGNLESDPIELGGSSGDALVAGAGSAFSSFAEPIPGLIDQAENVVLIF